jgi:hypothetical protein
MNTKKELRDPSTNWGFVGIVLVMGLAAAGWMTGYF